MGLFPTVKDILGSGINGIEQEKKKKRGGGDTMSVLHLPEEK